MQKVVLRFEIKFIKIYSYKTNLLDASESKANCDRVVIHRDKIAAKFHKVLILRVRYR